MTIGRPALLTEERVPTWRRACLAYHEWRQAGASDYEAHEAAVAACRLSYLCRGRSQHWGRERRCLRDPLSFWQGAQHTEKWRENGR